MEKKIVTMRINGDLILGSEKGILDCANSGGTISLNSHKENTTIEHSFDSLVLGGDIRIEGSVYIENLKIPVNVCASIICNRIIISKTKQIEKVDINTVWDVSSNGVYHFNALSAFGISQSPNYVETKTRTIDYRVKVDLVILGNLISNEGIASRYYNDNYKLFVSSNIDEYNIENATCIYGDVNVSGDFIYSGNVLVTGDAIARKKSSNVNRIK